LVQRLKVHWEMGKSLSQLVENGKTFITFFLFMLLFVSNFKIYGPLLYLLNKISPNSCFSLLSLCAKLCLCCFSPSFLSEHRCSNGPPISLNYYTKRKGWHFCTEFQPRNFTVFSLFVYVNCEETLFTKYNTLFDSLMREDTLWY
jgi:hypothetical protein